MIKTTDLSFSYKSSKNVLKNITMTLAEGKIYGLLGENGVGKTTLLTLLCGLKKPSRGTIEVDGRAPFRREPSLLSNQYFLSEDVAPVPMTAAKYARTYGKFWSGFDADKFAELMEMFETAADKRMDRLSAGQLKKTYICFALACNAKYLYLDEPTNGLDIPSKAQFRRAVSKYVAEDSTLVISTHQVRDLENIIDPIIILDRQDVLLNASIEEIARKLYFATDGTRHGDALYTEATIGGSIEVLPNLDGRESKVNIEALFNAVHLHKELIKNMFRG